MKNNYSREKIPVGLYEILGFVPSIPIKRNKTKKNIHRNKNEECLPLADLLYKNISENKKTIPKRYSSRETDTYLGKILLNA